MIDGWRGYLGLGTLRGIATSSHTTLFEGTGVLKGTASLWGRALIGGIATLMGLLL